jgi:D-tagatose-1,6-bisphosphate aldolase subunit GatZ/KbaZ
MLREIIAQNRRGRPLGVYSICSAHRWVLEAALVETREDGSLALIESTSNQVNQYGGYTGQRPAEFASEVRRLAERAGLPAELLLLGGDHLGPHPWRKEPAGRAMEEACRMVRDYVAAGYTKIHLDASMACGGDRPGALDPEVAAGRAARLCQAAEQADGRQPRLYVIGTEVPVPGGEQSEAGPPPVTRPEDAQATLALHREAFRRLGLDGAFERVIGLVVQPGVEFGANEVFDYQRSRARTLSAGLPDWPELVYEAHSTDYQTPGALRDMVEDHFAILKVGPWLTFAMREAVLALVAIEREWLGARRGVRLSRVWEAIEDAMRRDPRYWTDYYRGREDELRLARRYSYSDRVRYYWPDPAVVAEVAVLVKNLSEQPPPPPLLSQFLPAQYEALREGVVANEPICLVQHRIRQVLRFYAAACRSFTPAPEPGASPKPSRKP